MVSFFNKLLSHRENKVLKKDIDLKISKYEYSNFWDRFFHLFWLKSESGSFQEISNEWQLSGFKLEEKDAVCEACHSPKTRYFYEITNQKTGQKMNVGRSCAADLVFKPNMQKYNEVTQNDFQKFLQVLAKKTVFQRNRLFLDKHAFDIEHAFSLLYKYRNILELSEKDTNALLSLHQKFLDARASITGKRKSFIFWHDLEMKKLDDYLSKLKTSLSYFYFTVEELETLKISEKLAAKIFRVTEQGYVIKNNSFKIVSNVLNNKNITDQVALMINCVLRSMPECLKIMQICILTMNSLRRLIA